MTDHDDPRLDDPAVAAVHAEISAWPPERKKAYLDYLRSVDKRALAEQLDAPIIRPAELRHLGPAAYVEVPSDLGPVRSIPVRKAHP
ncbi:hypothetical protein QSJ19_24900 [Gordonia sp. ABSL11-1]|uniref:hypothetical protein n=1 Tax=Gordonia sp. ABSL11-1 TaxID=3053924 RepID=UPI0025744A4A|nr:hypothetical protein [Gordonia sp. ABSL11-1]MDL9948765.1 hypothetical protein [Gordonia sp. ABSL11-1]